MIRKIFPWFDPNIKPKDQYTSLYSAQFRSYPFFKFQNDANIEPVKYRPHGPHCRHYYLAWKTKNNKHPWRIRFGSYNDVFSRGTWEYVPKPDCSISCQNQFGWKEHEICNTVFVSDNEQEINDLVNMLNDNRYRYRNLDAVFDEFMANKQK